MGKKYEQHPDNMLANILHTPMVWPSATWQPVVWPFEVVKICGQTLIDR